MPPCFAQPSILRKPLLSAELAAARKNILVTGATGYIGSRIVERLLSCGHGVHVLCRPRLAPGPGDMLQYLKMLPGADQHLTVINGDVTNAASLQAAMVGCEQLVHLAAVVDIKPPTDDQHKQQMISTALEGTRIVLNAATASGSIRKVILASSIVSIMWDWWERGSDYVYSEKDWTLDSSVELNCYAYCKRESERLAYQIAQGNSWELVTINPGIVFGPVAAPKLAESASVWQPIVEHMNGTKYPFTSNLYVSHVDVDDVAAATCGLLATPGATGRHMLMSGPAHSMPQIASLLAAAYPTAKVACLTAPGFIVALLAMYNTQKLGFDIHKFRAMHNKPYTVNASKITRVLPDFTYIPLPESARAAADSVVAMGLASFHAPGCLGSLWRLGVRLAQLCSSWGAHAAGAASCAMRTAVPAASVGAAAAATAAAPAMRSCESQDGQLVQEVLIEGAVSEGDEDDHGVMAVVISPAGSNSKLQRLELSAVQLAELQGVVQQV